MRKFARTDANHKQIVAALRAAGAMVVSMAPLGSGVPDVAVTRRSWVGWRFAEIKDGRKPPSERRLTDDEVAWHQEALAHGQPVAILTSVDEALAWLQEVDKL